jgi:hypothetical protein
LKVSTSLVRFTPLTVPSRRSTGQWLAAHIACCTTPQGT